MWVQNCPKGVGFRMLNSGQPWMVAIMSGAVARGDNADSLHSHMVEQSNGRNDWGTLMPSRTGTCFESAVRRLSQDASLSGAISVHTMHITCHKLIYSLIAGCQCKQAMQCTAGIHASPCYCCFVQTSQKSAGIALQGCMLDCGGDMVHVFAPWTS